MIISGGSNIYPAEVENVIGGHPAVQDIAVIGMPDELSGETVCAVIVCHSGAVVTEQEILDWCDGKTRGLQKAAVKSPSSTRVKCRARRPARSSTATYANDGRTQGSADPRNVLSMRTTSSAE